MLVQSEFAGIGESLACLRAGGLDAGIISWQSIRSARCFPPAHIS